ncbi:CDGSH iron-sulfur domain-containing protein [Rubrivirga sp. IMCC43871]|uniref:CDGSH iron-sulfur domain-containing protein n=1 Tax=Rubrivirga sp. IMCC43871 TaxID=3391575 RepID=UPI00398FFC64
MDSKSYTYEGADATVTWDKARCIHFAACVHGLPKAFDTSRRRWIDPDAADPDALLAVVRRCPTGALHLQAPDGTDPEPTLETAQIVVGADGPLYVSGDVTVQTVDGEVLLRDTRVALCRCGLSANKPLCDNSHLDSFADPGHLEDTGTLLDTAEVDAVLTLTPRPDGPLLVAGPVTIVASDGTAVTKAKAALCRCGHSQNKPFCDGSHREAGFVAA